MDAGPGGEMDGGADALLASFARWAADERLADSGRQRSRERWLRQQAAEAASLTGVLTDLAEAGSEVVVATPARSWAGSLVGVARDFCVLEDRRGAAVLVATAAVTSLSTAAGRRGTGGPGDPSGDRPPPIRLRLVDALEVLAAERSPVQLVLGPDQLVTGDLLAVGSDVVTLRAERPARSLAYVPIERIQACQPR